MGELIRYEKPRTFYLTYGTILLFVLLGYIVRSAKYEFGPELQIRLSIVSIGLIVVFWESLRIINNYLNRVMPFERGTASRVIVQLLSGALVGLLIRYFIYRFGEPYLPFKLDELFAAATWVIYVFVPCSVNLGFFTMHLFDRWKRSLILAEKLEREKTQVQFDNLKNQLNPHFLFNALTSLNSLIFTDQKLASEFLQQLSKVFRYVLQSREKTTVSLQVELTFIRHYIDLLKTRFSGSLLISVDVDNNELESEIVPVTLQVLIENAIKHNVIDEARPLYIKIKAKGGYVEVRNNLQPRKRVEESNKQGLENLSGLYGFLTPMPFVIESDEGEFVVKVPLIAH